MSSRTQYSMLVAAEGKAGVGGSITAGSGSPRPANLSNRGGAEICTYQLLRSRQDSWVAELIICITSM